MCVLDQPRADHVTIYIRSTTELLSKQCWASYPIVTACKNLKGCGLHIPDLHRRLSTPSVAATLNIVGVHPYAHET